MPRLWRWRRRRGRRLARKRFAAAERSATCPQVDWGLRGLPATEEPGRFPQDAIAGDWRAFVIWIESSEARSASIVFGSHCRWLTHASLDSPSAVSTWFLGARASKAHWGRIASPPMPFYFTYSVAGISAVSSSVSPSWRIISRARSASSYAAETSACTLAAASSISGERRTLR